MISDIKKNIESEVEMLREISLYNSKLNKANPSDRKLLMAAIDSLIESMRIINDSIPNLVGEIALSKEPINKLLKGHLENVSYKGRNAEFIITIPTKDKETLLKELSISEVHIKRLKRQEDKKKEEYTEFKAARGYLKLSNKIFWDYSVKWIKKGYFKNLSKELQKSNLDILFQSYIAMMFMSAFLAVIISFIVVIFLFFFSISLGPPFIEFYEGNYLLRLVKIFWIPIIVPVIVFISLYYYPNTEKQSIAKRVNQELPFAVIHMSAISGSGIQPSEIFRIIGLSKEYPYLRKEIRKILNQINLYGYDLVTALNNTASNTSSIKLAELFTGLATTITSGGEFSDFFQKRAETLLNDYRLERQKYAKTAETFMDIYISVVIAAPMVLMLLLIILTIGNFDIGFTTTQITFVIISVIAIINVFFLIFIHLNQPTY